MGQVVVVFLSCLLMATLMARQCQAATGLGKATIHQDFPDMCWERDQGKLYAVGEEWQMLSVCGVNTCEIIDNELYVQYATCSPVEASPPCYLVEGDPFADYPACCTDIVCP